MQIKKNSEMILNRVMLYKIGMVVGLTFIVSFWFMN